MGRMLDALRRIDASDASSSQRPETPVTEIGVGRPSPQAVAPPEVAVAPCPAPMAGGRPQADGPVTASVETVARREGPPPEERPGHEAQDAEAPGSNAAGLSLFSLSKEEKENPWGAPLRPLATVVRLPPRAGPDKKPPERDAPSPAPTTPEPQQVLGGASRWWKAPPQSGVGPVKPGSDRRTQDAIVDGTRSVPATPLAKSVDPPTSVPACGEVVSHVLQEFAPGRNATLLFCSPEADDSAANVVAALAAALDSQVTGQILVVDGGLGAIGLEPLMEAASRAEGEPQAESADVAGGKVGWQKAIRNTRLKHVDALLATAVERVMGAFGRNDSEEARHPRSRSPGAHAEGNPADGWAAALRQFRREYQFVLVGVAAADCPAAQAAARCTDATYLIVQPGQTGQRAARRAVGTLRQAGGRILGCLLVEHSVVK